MVDSRVSACQTQRSTTPAPLPPASLTSLAVISSKSERAVAAEGAPEVHTGAPVQARVVVAEMSFGRAPWPPARVTDC